LSIKRREKCLPGVNIYIYIHIHTRFPHNIHVTNTNMLFSSFLILVLFDSIYSLDNGLGKTPQMGLLNKVIYMKISFNYSRME
jgi:hypothetical protein